MNIWVCFTSEICKCLDLFSTPTALKHAQAKYAPTMFNSKWKYKKLAMVVCLTQATQNLVISHWISSFAEDSKEMYKGYTMHEHSYCFPHLTFCLVMFWSLKLPNLGLLEKTQHSMYQMLEIKTSLINW